MADHAVFAKAYYGYGMIAAAAYALLLLAALLYTYGKVRVARMHPGFMALYPQALFASLLGFLPWFIFGHAAVSQPRGAMLMFMLLGMIASLEYFYPAMPPSHQPSLRGPRP